MDKNQVESKVSLRVKTLVDAQLPFVWRMEIILWCTSLSLDLSEFNFLTGYSQRKPSILSR